MPTPIEALELQVQSNGTSAVAGLDALSESLSKIKAAAKGGIGLTSAIKQLGNLNSALTSFDIAKLDSLASALGKLGSLGNIKISSSIANQLKNIGDAVVSLGMADLSGIDRVSTALQPLCGLDLSGLRSALNSLKRLPEIAEALDGMDWSSFTGRIMQLSDALAPLTTQLDTVGRSFGKLPTNLKRVADLTDRVSGFNKKASKSYVNFWAKARMAYNAVRSGTQAISGWITQSNKYVEDLNLFNVSMGRYADQAHEYADRVSEVMGIDPAEWMRNQGVFNTITKGFGVASDRAYVMSQNLTQLGYDLSSFFNISYEDAFQKLQSGIAGELEPLRRLGYDLSVARLQEEALTLGIDKKVSAMTQAEKSELRYYAIMTQVTSAQGDMARTLSAPANQLRVLQAQITQCARALGNIFIPAINAVLPYVTAAVKVVRLLAEEFARLVGFELPEVDYSGITSGADEISDAYESASESAEEAKRTILGIDEINKLNGGDSADGLGEGFGGSGGFDFELPTYDFLGGLVDSRTNAIVDEIKSALTDISKQISKMKPAAVKVYKEFEKLAGLFKDGFQIGIGISDIGSVFDGIRSDIESIGVSVKNIFTSPEIGASMTSFAESFSSNLGIVAGSVVSIGTTIARNLIGGVEQYVSENADRIREFLANGLDFRAQMSDFAGRMASTISDIFSVFGSETAQTVTGNIVGTLAETYMSVEEFVRERTLDVVNRIVGTFEENKERFKETFATSFAGLADATDAIKESVGYITGTVLPDLEAAFSSALDMLEPVKNFLVDVFFSAWNDVLNPAIAKVGDAVRQATDVFKNLWENVLVPLGALIGNILSPAIDTLTFFFRNLWENVIKPLAQFVTETFFAAWEAVCALWDNVLLPVVSKIIEGFQYVWDKVFKPLVDWVETNIFPVFERAFGGIGNIIGDLKETMKNLLKFFTSVFKGDWKSAWESIKNVFKGIWDTLVDVVKTPINLVIGLINGMLQGIADGVNRVIDAVNSLSFEVPDWVPAIGGKTFGFDLAPMKAAQIPYLASGGLVPTGQMFIAREAGPELVGQIGNRSAVVNNDQIVESVSAGVYEANAEGNSLLREAVALLRAIEERDTTVKAYVTTSDIVSGLGRHNRRDGKTVVPVG